MCTAVLTIAGYRPQGARLTTVLPCCHCFNSKQSLLYCSYSTNASQAVRSGLQHCANLLSSFFKSSHFCRTTFSALLIVNYITRTYLAAHVHPWPVPYWTPYETPGSTSTQEALVLPLDLSVTVETTDHDAPILARMVMVMLSPGLANPQLKN